MLEDLYAQMNMIAFPNVYSDVEAFLKTDAIVTVSGRVTVGQNGVELLAGRIARYAPERRVFCGQTAVCKACAG